MKEKYKISAYLLIFSLSILIGSCKFNMRDSEIIRGRFEHDGIKREYIYYAPDNLLKNAPLVVVLHGYTSNAGKIMNYSDINTIAEENNFAVVYPQGTIDANSNTFWNVGFDFHSGDTTNDVDFIVKLVQFLQHEYSLSTENTFLTGMSNGGEMCYLLACKRPDVFSGIAPVAGVMLESFFDHCNSKISIPVFAVFGTQDAISHFEGDMNNDDGWGAYQSIPFTINYWAERISYTSVIIDTLPDIKKTDGSYIISEQFINDQSGLEVLFYKVINGGHDWPGAWGNKDIDVSREIWNFFEKHKQ